MSHERQQRLAQFVAWSTQHITGDEKGQAQIFLDRLFQAFGQRGSLDVGGTPEFRVRSSRDETGGGGGTSFADFVWKPIVLIEMKKRGIDFARHRQQAFDYWIKLVPNRPQYTVLCNFDEFRIYDFNIDLDDPLDTVQLAELPQRYEPLAFLFPTAEKPIFQNNRIEVTRNAADRLATVFNNMMTRKVDRALAQRFGLQMLVALFSEDIDLLPKNFVTNLLSEIKEPQQSYDLLGDLFEAMNRPGTPGGRFKGIRYFNGGLFLQPARVELDLDTELPNLREAAQYNWSKVSPEIFGTLFQDSMDKEQRHAFGAHYTAPIDIMKIVKPTIVDPWTQLIDAAKTPKKLADLLERLSLYTVLDPACGSGNFLYIAYRELKRLETKIRDRLRTEFPDFQATIYHVTARQFHGMDILPFAIELAKVTMMIARKLAIDELHIADEPPLPLDNLDSNFQCTDALLTPSSPTEPSGSAAGPASEISNLKSATPSGLPLRGVPNPQTATVSGLPLREPSDPQTAHPSGLPRREPSAFITAWPKTDVIIGNPPFLGAKRLKPERGPDYVNTLRALYPEVPGMADYCVYWFRRAHDHLPLCTPDRPEIGRAGLVGTQNIRNNQSRVGGLDHIVQSGGVIIEAVENQPWSGEANVHVSIANWVKVKVVPTPSSAVPVSNSEISNLKSNAVPSVVPTPPSAAASVAPSQRDALSNSEISNPKSAPPKPADSIGADQPTSASAKTPSQNEPLTPALAKQLLIPEKKKLWFKSDPKLALFSTNKKSRTQSVSTPGKSGKTLASKSYELDFREVSTINAAISDQADVGAARILNCNTEPKHVFQGVTPGHSAFVLERNEYESLIKSDPRSREIIHPYLVGREVLSGDGVPDRYLIDFQQRNMIEAQSFSGAFHRIEKQVLPDRLAGAEKGKDADGDMRPHHKQFLERWWKLAWDRADMIADIAKLHGRFLVCSRVTKRPIFLFICSDIRPGDALQTFLFDDDYSFGILQSAAHWLWFTTKCSKLKSDFRYTPESVFDTFPWPQSPTKKQINVVAEAGREIRRIRTAALQKLPGGLRALYRTLELPGQNPLKDAHAALDAAVLNAYNFPQDSSLKPQASPDLLSQLLTPEHGSRRPHRSKPTRHRPRRSHNI